MSPGDESIVLPRSEAEHLTRVLRLGAGDAVAVFDGRGREFLARVVTAGRDVSVQLVSRIEAAAEPSVPLTLVQAVLKTDKMDWDFKGEGEKANVAITRRGAAGDGCC